jgi:ABC-2 type transport system permease protein
MPTSADIRRTLLIARATLWRKRVSLLSFALGAAGFQILVAFSFPAIGGLETVNSVVSTFPDGLRHLLKIAPNLQVGFGLADYLAFTWIHPVFLGLGAAMVVGRAADGLAGQIETGQIYLWLSRPVPRWALVWGKGVELVGATAVFSLLSWLGMLLGLWLALPQDAVATLPLAAYARIALMAWPLFTALGGGALLISSLSSRATVAGGLGAAWTLLSFVADVVPAFGNSPLAWLNPWHHYYPQEILNQNQLPWSSFLYLWLFYLLTLVLATLFFNRRDLV